MGIKDHKKEKELEEARKAGLAPAEVDEDGNEINPHIPGYISNAPWYLTNSEKPTLSHQRERKSKPSDTTKTSYKRGLKGFQADKFRKGACTNCGAMTHDVKSCVERPRKLGAKFTGKYIAADEIMEQPELDYDGKRDRWNGYDPASYAQVVYFHDAKEEARLKYLKSEKLKKLDEEEEEEEVDEAKIDESKQMDFAKVNKRVRTTDGGSTGTARNLRIREDTAKYLLNLDVGSAHYDPKSRSMREDPLPDDDPNEKFYAGDNQNRISGQALELNTQNLLAHEALEKGLDVHLQAAPSQAELTFKVLKARKEKFMSQLKDSIMNKYGNAATQEEIPQELLFGQSERQVEYDRAGRIIIGQETSDLN